MVLRWEGKQEEEEEEEGEYLADIRTDLAYFSQEAETGHPFVRAETGFSGEVVEMGDEAFEDVAGSVVLAERVDSDDVFGDVVDGEVFHGGDFDGGGIHFVQESIERVVDIWMVLE